MRTDLGSQHDEFCFVCNDENFIACNVVDASGGLMQVGDASFCAIQSDVVPQLSVILAAD